jgi:hypothetical protein
MTTMNWNRVRQENQARKFGRDYADDLPAFGTWADQQRVVNRSGNEARPVELKRTRGPIPKVKYGATGSRPKPAKPPRELAKCPVCGQMVGRMRRHLEKAHGHLEEVAQSVNGQTSRDLS